MVEGGKIAILGAGTWGSTLAALLGNHGKSIVLWSHNKAKAEEIARTRQITKPLEIRIPNNVEITHSLENSLKEAEIVIFCCTAQSLQSVATQVQECVANKQGKPIMVSAAKGIEVKTFKRMSQVLSQTMPNHPACVLSGPNLAYEILQGLPTASVVASSDLRIAAQVQEKITTKIFRIYTSDDLIGVELGGALKNIIAIASGVADGLNLGVNAKAALMTRGLSEITRLSLALGAKTNTLYGLSGMGDLIATCYSSLSRNYRIGFQMARGESLDKAATSLGSIAEGVTTAYAACDLAKTIGIELPIAEHVKLLLNGELTAKEAIMKLMSRPLTNE